MPVVKVTFSSFLSDMALFKQLHTLVVYIHLQLYYSILIGRQQSCDVIKEMFYVQIQTMTALLHDNVTLQCIGILKQNSENSVIEMKKIRIKWLIFF